MPNSSGKRKGWKNNPANSRYDMVYNDAISAYIDASGIDVPSGMTATIEGTLTASGTSTFSGTTTVSGAATLSGGAALSGTNTLSGTTTISSAVILTPQDSSSTTSGSVWVDNTTGNLHMYYSGAEYYFTANAV